jgi:D-tyrosyl-tRNA(Tyr) deacylase
MRVIIQRVKSSQVTVNDEIVGKIGRGLNLLVGIADTDSDVEIDWMVRKCWICGCFLMKRGETDGKNRCKKLTASY